LIILFASLPDQGTIGTALVHLFAVINRTRAVPYYTLDFI